jgi:hypothetical protein
MLAQDNIDFSAIDWNSITQEKAQFILNEALEHHRSIIENNNRTNDKALGMLSFTMPIMTALAGYFAIFWGDTSLPLFLASIFACICLFVTVLSLLLILIPRGINQGAGSPGAYFTDEYYKRDMRGLLIGNITNLHECILSDRELMYKRAFCFRIAVTFYAILPVVSFLAFLLCPRN